MEDKPNYYGDAAKGMYLPFFKPVKMPPPHPEQLFLPSIVAESCAFKVISGGLMGSVLGVGMGLFMGAMGGDVSAPLVLINGREVPQAPLREQIRTGFKSTLGKSGGWAKSFGILTAAFGGVECVVEKYRGKHDVWNPMLSGCVVGGTMSAKGGPAAACIGCAGFAGFSLIVDKIMGPH